MMKKSVNKGMAAAMAAAMMMSVCSMSAMAADDNNTKSTQVKYSVTESYEWSIHSEIDFGSTAGINQTVEKGGNKVEVTKNVIADGKKLQIKVKGSETDGSFKIANGNSKLDYTIKKAGFNTAIEANGSVLEVAAGTNTGSQALTFTLSTTTDTAEVAGNYEGTVTYTASIE